MQIPITGTLIRQSSISNQYDLTASISVAAPGTASNSYTDVMGIMTSGDILIILALVVLILLNLFAVFRRYA